MISGMQNMVKDQQTYRKAMGVIAGAWTGWQVVKQYAPVEKAVAPIFQSFSSSIPCGGFVMTYGSDVMKVVCGAMTCYHMFQKSSSLIKTDKKTLQKPGVRFEGAGVSGSGSEQQQGELKITKQPQSYEEGETSEEKKQN